jgi:hypothetical protein
VDLKAVTEVAKALGPTKEHRQQFGRTFLGTLLGQATAFLLMLVIYVIALVFLSKLAVSDLHLLQAAVGESWFWALTTIPLICIVLFSLVPTLWRAARERRLKEKVISGETLFKPGYFRLYPYGGSDFGQFERLDGAGLKILNWLKSSPKSLLYLSGGSGVGKSSLLAADVLPKLSLEDWAIIQVRLIGDAMARVTEALVNAPGLFVRRPSTDLSLRDIFHRAAEIRKRDHRPPLMLVIDQFEEFLILQNETARAPFAQFLVEIGRDPIDGIQILLIFRSDYRALVFKLELPPLVAGENWQELAPYGRGEATAFIQGGGRLLSAEALDELFKGLDRIDGIPGLYRPITLNMVGLVLERMGQTLEEDPAQLVQRYLRDCLIGSESRDFAKPVLTHMITDAGTKEPRSENVLVTLTGFQSWQVQASLADLSERGIVRRLEGKDFVWEIAHDFIARLLGQLLGRIRQTLIVRARPFIAPAVLVTWIVLTPLGVMFWSSKTQPARIIIDSVQPLKLSEDKDELPVNVYVKNVGGRPTNGVAHWQKPPAVIVDEVMPNAELDRIFEKFSHLPETLDFGSEDREVQPGEQVFGTLFLPDGKKIEQALQEGKRIYVMFTRAYWEKSLGPRHYYVLEGCFILSKFGAPNICSSHNRTYIH